MFRSLYAAFLICSFTQLCSADFVLSTNLSVLQPNAANQRFSVFAAWDGNGNSNVAGMDLFMRIDNPATLANPPRFRTGGNFSAFAFSSTATNGGGLTSSSTTIWDTILQSDSISFSGRAPEAGNSRNIALGMLSNNLTSFDFGLLPANTPRLIGQFIIDTTGATPGGYSLFIGDTAGAASDFVFNDASAISIAGNFNFTVTGVPEPSVLGLVSLSLIGAARFRKKFTRRLASGQ